MRARLFVLAPLVGIVLATGAQAAPTTAPQVKDPAGDSVGAQAGTDIVSTLFTTAGTGSGKRYQPKQLFVTLTMAGPVATNPGLTYEVAAKTSTCGDVEFTFEPGTPYEKITGLNGWASWGSCTNQDGDGAIELLTVTVNGNKIIWEFGLKAISLKVGAVLTGFEVRVDPSNPVVPFPARETNSALGLIDKATAAGPWTLG